MAGSKSSLLIDSPRTCMQSTESQPHAAYTVFTKGYKSKFTFFMRTIESFEDYVDPIQEAIDD